MKNIFPKLMLCLSLVAGCTLDDADYVLIEELDYAFVAEDGTYVKDDGTFAVPADGGSITFRLLANASVTLVPRGGMPQWAQADQLAFDGDDNFTVTMEQNSGFRRGVIFDVSLEGSDKKIVLIAKQEGLVPYLGCQSPYRTVKGSESSDVEFLISTNLPREEISIANTTAAFEPKLDYVIAKLPRFPFDKFTNASNLLGTQMKATGEVMGIGSNLEECLLRVSVLLRLVLTTFIITSLMI